MKYTDVMLDLETLGLRPNAVILQVGLIPFNSETGEIGKPYSLNINYQESIQLGFTVDSSTIDWWEDQDKEVFKSLKENPCSVNGALNLITDFIKHHTVGIDHVKVWGNGSDFDNVKLLSYYDKVGLPHPWNYKNSRCARTMFAIYKDVVPRTYPEVSHVAVNDALAQAKTIIEIFKYINSTKPLKESIPEEDKE